MNVRKSRRLSYLLSVTAHVALLGLFWIISFDLDYDDDQWVEIGFGTSGIEGSAGAVGNQLEGVRREEAEAEESSSSAAETEQQEVNLPEAENTSENDVTTKSEQSEHYGRSAAAETPRREERSSSVSRGNRTSGAGSLGYDIDWGGRGKRKLLTTPPILPTYPAGVNKEIDIRLRFTILPDGTVGGVIPLTKADTRLENAAMNALRQWRFERLPSGQRNVVQTAIIVFPYRLR